MRPNLHQQELPVLNPKIELPDLPVYNRHRPLILLPLFLALVALTALMSVPASASLFRGLALILLVLSLIAAYLMTKNSLEDRSGTTNFLNTHTPEFITAVKERYGVVITETILYSLAQGGSSNVTDKDGELRRVKIGGLPGENKTKLLTIL